MKSTRIFFVLLFLIACSSDDNKGPDIDPDTYAYMEEVIDALEKNSVNRKTIDWTNFRTETYKYVQNASQINEGIKRALTMLNDPLARAERNRTAITTDNSNSGTCSPGLDWASSFDKSIGYVLVFWRDEETDSRQAGSFQSEIQMQDSEDLKGWVIDLRISYNAKFWPTLAGIGPVLGDGVAGYFTDPDGKTTEWKYENGKAMQGVEIAYDLKHNYYDIVSGDKKVAIIIGPGTGAAGEALALSFRGRANTRIFGRTSCGIASNLDSLTLSDNTKIWLATSFLADRTKNKQTSVIPDEIIQDKDAIDARVVEWLNEP